MYEFKIERSTLWSLIQYLKSGSFSTKNIRVNKKRKKINLTTIQKYSIGQTKLKPVKMAIIKTTTFPINLKPFKHIKIPN